MRLLLLTLFCCLLGGLQAQKPTLILPKGHSSFLTSVDFSPDGELILTGAAEGTAKIWSKKGRLLQTIQKHQTTIEVALFSPDGQSILTVSQEKNAYLWSLDGQLLTTFQEPQANFYTATFAPDGQSILTSNDALEIKIWDINGQVLQTFSGHSNWVTQVDFSPDGQQVLTGSQDRTIKIWDTSGNLIRIIQAHDDYITTARFSPDGREILSSSADKTLKLWTVEGQLLSTLDNLQKEVSEAVFSPNGQQLLTCSEDGTTLLLDLKGRLLQDFSDVNSPVTKITFSDDGQRVLTGGLLGTVKVWSLEGQLITEIKGEADDIRSIKITPDGQYLLIHTGEGKAKKWDLKNQLVKPLQTPIDTIGSIAFSPDGQQLLLGGNYDDGQLVLTDLQGQVQKAFPAHEYSINEVVFSPDGQRLGSVSWDKTAKVWSRNGELLYTLNAGDDELSSIDFSPDGQTVLTGSTYGPAQIWNNQGQAVQEIKSDILRVKTVDFSPDGQSVLLAGANGETSMVIANTKGQILQTFDGDIDIVEAAAFSPDGALIASAGWDLSAKIWDRNGPLLHQLNGHEDRLTSLAFFPNGNILLTGSFDNTVRLWSVQTGQALATLIILGEDDWIVSTPSGLFDASPKAMQLLYYVVAYEGSLEVIELEQLKARYYEPGLLAKILDFSEERIRPVDDFEQVALYPEVKASINNGLLSVELKERNGGLGGVSVFINGKEVVTPVETEEGTPSNTLDRMQYDLSQYQNLMYRHPDSINSIKVRAYNAEGWLKSPAVDLPYQLPAGNAKGRRSKRNNTPAVLNTELDPKLFVVSIGTSNYTGTKLDLKYADQDATVMAQAMQAVSSNLFLGAAGVEVFCFSTASPDSTGLEGTPIQWQFSNKKNIEQTFEVIRGKAKAEDVLLVYLSGHGITYGNARNSQFHYLTQGIADDDLSDRAVRRAFTISSEELTKWINDIPALKQVLIIDACNSGQVVDNLTSGTKNLNSSQIRALDRMKDRTGMFILSGSASDKVSYEASEYGQGLLTYALLQGMLGVAARKTVDGEYIDVMSLFQYARDEVPRLAASINGIQTPMLGFPSQGASFDLGLLNDQVKAKIPVGNRKPVFIRSIFLNEEAFTDDQNLVDALQSNLQKETAKGKNADLIYIDVNNYPQAYAVRGLYKMNNNNIELRAKLIYGDEKIDLAVRSTDDPERLMKFLMRSIKKAIEDRK